MPKPYRLAGRFFSVLISLIFAFSLPRPLAAFQGLTLCQVTDVVYRADGTPAQGTVVLLWSAFTTAAGQPVAAGSLSVELGPQGQFSAGLAPNSGATPAGTYYRVTYKLNDAVAGKTIADPNKFQDSLGKVIDGVVGCLNASIWANKA